jgi:hypothetical protein
MSNGAAGFVGYGKEATWGTAVSATDYVEIMNESMRHNFDRFDIKNAFAGLYEPDRQAGIVRVAGGVSAAAYPDFLGAMCAGAMGTKSGAVVLSGFLHTTRFVNAQADFADGVPSQPYTLEVFRDVTSSHRYAGCVVNRLQLSLSPNQPLMAAVEFIAQDGTLLTKSSPTFQSSPAYPFAFDTASIQIGGSANTRVEAFTLSIDNQLEGVPRLNNSTKIAAIRRRGPQIIRLSGTLDFIDVTEQLDFINQTERAFKLALFKTDSFQFTVDVPRLVYAAVDPNIRGRDRNTASFEGEARFKVTSNTALGLYLTTVKSTF